MITHGCTKEFNPKLMFSFKKIFDFLSLKIKILIEKNYLDCL